MKKWNMYLVGIIAIALLASCASVQPTKTAIMTYKAEDYFGKYEADKAVLAFFFIPIGLPTPEDMKGRALDHAAEVHRKGAEEVLIVNETYAVRYPWWNWTYNWITYFGLSCYWMDYSAEIIARPTKD